jgi:hypothetical protein
MCRWIVRGSVPPGRATWIAALLVLLGCSTTPTEIEDPEEEEEEPSVAAVTVTSPLGALLAAGVELQLEAEAADGDGAAMTGLTFDWSSSDEDVATVSGSGLVKTLAAGPVAITATADGVDGDVSLTVAAADLEGITTVVDDPFTEALHGAVSDPAESSIGAALADCRDGAASGGLTAIQQCVTGVRAAIEASADAGEAPLLAVLAILMDRVERLLNL